MRHFYQSSLTILLLAVPISASSAYKLKDGDGVVTLKNGKPCFSYPEDSEVKENKYSLRSVGIMKGSSGVAWEIDRSHYDHDTLPEPSSVGTCIEYGVVGKGMRVRQEAMPLQHNVPYRVNIHLKESPGVGVAYQRDYWTNFCVTTNEKKEPIIVEASGAGRGEWRCLKPGEKRGFWDWLFGE